MYDRYDFSHPRLNCETFQKLNADPSDLADTIPSVPGSADSFMGPSRIERIDTYGPSVAFTESVSVYVNAA